jgi:amino acid transporter
MVWINLRGTGEAGNVFAIPTYMFILSIILMFGKGIWDLASGHVGHPGMEFHVPLQFPTQLSFFLLLSAFANGCSAATGIETIADAVPHFRTPSAKNAKRTYIRLGFLLAFAFGAVTLQTLPNAP